MTEDKTFRAILDAINKMRVPGYAFPTDAFHPRFGWILRDGQPTENTEEYLEYLKNSGLIND